MKGAQEEEQIYLGTGKDALISEVMMLPAYASQAEMRVLEEWGTRGKSCLVPGRAWTRRRG